MPQGVWSIVVCRALHHSDASPSLLVEGARALVPMPGSRHDHPGGQMRSLHMLLQSSVGWRDVLNRAHLCKELLSRLVDVLAFACAVIQEYYKPHDDMHCVLLEARLSC